MYLGDRDNKVAVLVISHLIDNCGRLYWNSELQEALGIRRGFFNSDNVHDYNAFINELIRKRSISVARTEHKHTATIAWNCNFDNACASGSKRYHIIAVEANKWWKFGCCEYISKFDDTEFVKKYVNENRMGQVFRCDIQTNSADYYDHYYALRYCGCVRYWGPMYYKCSNNSEQYEDWDVKVWLEEFTYCGQLVPSDKKKKKIAEEARKVREAAEAKAKKERDAAERERQQEENVVNRSRAIYTLAKQALQSGRCDEREAGVLLYFIEKTTFHVAECLHPSGHTKLALDDVWRMMSVVADIFTRRKIEVPGPNAPDAEMLRVAKKIERQIQDRAVRLFKDLESMKNDERHYGKTCRKLLKKMMVMASDIASGHDAPDSAVLEDIMKAKHYVKTNRDRIDARGFGEEYRNKVSDKRRREERADNIERCLEEMVAIGYEEIQAIYKLNDTMYSVTEAVWDSIVCNRRNTEQLASSFSSEVEKLAGVQLAIATEQDRRQRELIAETKQSGGCELKGMQKDLGKIEERSARFDHSQQRKGAYSIFD